MNKLVAIGFTGMYDVYLNVSREEAIKRWQQAHPGDPLPRIEEFEITDHFGSYEIWESL